MEDKEIIKALECCCDELHYCSVCPYFLQDKENDFCREDMNKDALDLINYQQAEIKELEAEIDEQYEQAEADILGNMPQGGASCHWCIDGHRKYAIKEFAERLKGNADVLLVGKNGNYYSVSDKDIDNLVKEMVGDTE